MRPPSGTEARPRRLGRTFYARHVLEVARALLGRRLCFESPAGRVGGRIVEVEAYRGRHDPASHAHRGPTPRSGIMFGPPGHLYVYLSYGVHRCMNVVCEPEGGAAAVLIRALEPDTGIETMRGRRPGVPDERLMSGPGNLTRALGIDLSHNGLDLAGGPMWIEPGPSRRAGRIVAGPRIGITRATGRPWRFHVAGHPSVSAARPAHAGTAVNAI